MFEMLFAESGLSLDRLRALVEVGASGSIVKAAEGDPVRQSQYSRQIRELEDFFRSKLVERHGKGMRLNANGRELARISRFFLLGLANFQRGCLREDQTFRIGASPTILHTILVPILSDIEHSKHSFVLEAASNDEVERRLHDLTLDFGVVNVAALSRPLQTKKVGDSPLGLFVPKRLRKSPASASQAFEAGLLPIALSRVELPPGAGAALAESESRIACDSFLSARQALQSGAMAAVLPEFLVSSAKEKSGFWRIVVPALQAQSLESYLAWNPRLLRLNPRIARTRDFLAERLARASDFS